MKTLLRSALALGLLGIAALSAHATLVRYDPNDADLGDLDHEYYYTWGIRDDALAANLAAGYEITSARLVLQDIYNWRPESDNLYIHLLDNPRTDVHRLWDNEEGGNAFAGQGVQIANWTDPFDDFSQRTTLIYDFDALGLLDELTSYLLTPPTFATRGQFGFGFDPDCHYFNSGVFFELTYERNPDDEPIIPEPATLGLLGLGLSGMGYLRRRKGKQ